MLPPSLQPYAKAVVPFVLALVAALGQFLVTGEFNRPEVVTALTGALTSLVTLLVPNAPAAGLPGVPDEEPGIPDVGDSDAAR